MHQNTPPENSLASLVVDWAQFQQYSSLYAEMPI